MGFPVDFCLRLSSGWYSCHRSFFKVCDKLSVLVCLILPLLVVFLFLTCLEQEIFLCGVQFSSSPTPHFVGVVDRFDVRFRCLKHGDRG